MKLMTTRSLLLVALVAIGSVRNVDADKPETAMPTAGISFNFDIRPILSKHCIACHGPDDADRQADLRLDTRDGATEDFGGYSAIAPGDPDASELIVRIETDDEDLRMPPVDHADRLSDHEIALLRQWVASGANYETHWSFVVPRKAAVPVFDEANFDGPITTNHEIDAFILARLQVVGLSPNPPSEPRALIRRVSLDLTGLPPQSHESVAGASINAYLREPTPERFAAVVDALLASEAYAEHWAAMWMDIARYADTVGYAQDDDRDIWPWRDWLIGALRENLSYEQFTTEMLAGDLLPDATDSQRLATAFHRNTLSNNEGGTSDEEFRIIAVKDRISTTVNAWMGLTLRCAECHTHKYDPITQTEYYQFLDFFNQTADADTRDDSPRLDTRPAGREKLIATLDREIETLQTKLDMMMSEQAIADDKAKVATKADERAKKATQALTKQIAALVARRDGPVRVPVLAELPADTRRETFVMLRGNHLSHGDRVSADFPASFHSMPDDTPRNRLGVAQWLFAPQNPLTARVAVNRYWARLFGIGIVETEEDFGTQGSAPSHPELLDWLAVDFAEHGWDVRRLIKQMVMSATYQQSPATTPESLRIDPRNRLHSRGPRIRLPAEVARDQALAVSGLLVQKLYGPPVYPPSPIKQIINAFTGGMTWTDSVGEDRYRRTIYTFIKRSQPHPLLETFDMATREVCSMRRLRTNTPLQSFMTLNDIMFVEAARSLANQMLDAGEEATTRQRIQRGLQTALFVETDPSQVDVLDSLHGNVMTQYESNVPDAAKLIGQTYDQASTPPGSDAAKRLADRAAMTVVANVILNLDTFLNN